MPSKAFKELRVHLVTVSRLIEAHGDLTDNARGKKALSHITRSGIVMLCACWEDYVESLLTESVEYLANNVASANALPDEIRKYVSLKIKEDKNELSPFLLAGRGWADKLKEYCREEVDKFHSPKAEKLNALYKRYLGVSEFSALWSVPSREIDDFVTLRGAIAHKGKGDYIKCPALNNYRDKIYANCLTIDGAICSHLHGLAGASTQPWRKATR